MNNNNQKEKFKKFIIGGIIFWVILVIIFLILSSITSGITENETDSLLSGLNGLIFIFGICGIPIIMFFYVLLQFAQKVIDKIPTKE